MKIDDGKKCGLDLEPVLVREIAEEAVRERLGSQYVSDYGTAGCVRDVYFDDAGDLIVHLNSGGNALAAASSLRCDGYEVRAGPPVEYGCALIVSQYPVRDWGVER